MYVLGLDLGTQGTRGVICDGSGNVAASMSAGYERLSLLDSPVLREQAPDDWWASAKTVIAGCVAKFVEGGHSADEITALAMDGTSATILLVDREGNPLTNGIMYNDGRAGEQAATLNQTASAHEEAMGYRFNSSYALPKLMWLKENMGDAYGRAFKLLHQADYIAGKLTGDFTVSDFSNALKTGYDIVEDKWPDFIGDIGIDMGLLPRVLAPGEVMGSVCGAAAKETGLSVKTLVCAGATDGYASALAAGALAPGEWASIIGTTFVLKGVTAGLIRDKRGRVYCHRHPQGYYMPGGASNVGGRCLNEEFGKENLSQLDEGVLRNVPTGALIYPLSGRGERFPFVKPDAVRMISGEVSAKSVRYAAFLEGVGYVERLSYDTLGSLGCEVGDVIYTTGGAAKSQPWLKVRASILNKTLRVPAMTDAAMGSAMLAASKTLFGCLNDAGRSMVRIVADIEPDGALVRKYNDIYPRFRQAVRECYGVTL